MPKAKPSLDILKQFAALEKKATQQVLSTKKSIEKKISREVAAVHKKYAKELKQIDSMFGRLGLSSVTTPKAKSAKAPTGGKRSRRTLAKLTKIISGGKKVSSAVIFSEVPLARPRFTAFLKANKNFLHIEGNKRSTLYSLKD